MDAIVVELALPQDKFDMLTEIARRENKTAMDLSLEMLLKSIEQEAERQIGYRILLAMPDTAGESGLSYLARGHDRYLYE